MKNRIYDFTDVLIEAYFDQELDSEYETKIKQLETELAAADALVKRLEATLYNVPTVEARIEAERPELFAQFKEFSSKRKALANEIQYAKADLQRLNSYSANEWDPQGTVGGAKSRNELRSTCQTRITKAEQALKDFEETNAEMMSLLDEYTKRHKTDMNTRRQEYDQAVSGSRKIRSARNSTTADRRASRIAAASNKTVESLDDLNAFLKDWVSIFDADKYYQNEYASSDAAASDLKYALDNALFYSSTEYTTVVDDDNDKQYLELHFEDNDLTEMLYDNIDYSDEPAVKEPLVLNSNLTYKQISAFLDAVVDILGEYFYNSNHDNSYYDWY